MKYLKSITALLLLQGLISCGNNTAAKNSSGETNTAAWKDNAVDASGSGSGYYYEMTINTHSARMNLTMLMKLFLSPDGKVRTEMTSSGLPGKAANDTTVMIGKANNPNESTSIDDAAKTYTVNKTDPGDIVPDEQLRSQAVKVGEEKIGDHTCVHAKITVSRNMGPLGEIADTINIWRSTEVPLPDQFKKWMDEFEKRTGNAMYSLATVKELEQMGCTGFPVKLQFNGKTSQMVMKLTKTARKDLPAALFEIPAGYKQEQ